MNRRNFLRGIAGGALGAAVGALTLKRGIGLPEAERGVQGQQVGASATLSAMPFSGANWPSDTNWAKRDTNGGAAFGEMTLVTGPDPDTMAHIRFDESENATVVPPGMETPNEFLRTWAIPRTLFPEYDPVHGVVPLGAMQWSHSGDNDFALLRTAYATAILKRRLVALDADYAEALRQRKANDLLFRAMTDPRGEPPTITFTGPFVYGSSLADSLPITIDAGHGVWVGQ